MRSVYLELRALGAEVVWGCDKPGYTMSVKYDPDDPNADRIVSLAEETHRRASGGMTAIYRNRHLLQAAGLL